jgi:hypothetical protein
VDGSKKLFPTLEERKPRTLAKLTPEEGQP